MLQNSKKMRLKSELEIQKRLGIDYKFQDILEVLSTAIQNKNAHKLDKYLLVVENDLFRYKQEVERDIALSKAVSIEFNPSFDHILEIEPYRRPNTRQAPLH